MTFAPADPMLNHPRIDPPAKLKNRVAGSATFANLIVSMLSCVGA